MKISPKKIYGSWDKGVVLDKHISQSICLGEDEHGRVRFDNERTEVGEALYQLKYQDDFSKVKPLAQAFAAHILADNDIYENVNVIVPMPATLSRQRQPVTEVANELGEIIEIPVYNDLLLKTANGVSIKNLNTVQEKIDAVDNSLNVNDVILDDGVYNVLIIDDLYDTGTTMESACKKLQEYSKIGKIYVAALTYTNRK